MPDYHCFDPEQDVTIAWKSLPHWAQAGTLTFITWRTEDSMPTHVLERFAAERNDLLLRFGLNPNGNWKRDLEKLPPRERGRVQWSLFTLWDEKLDHGHGECVLVRPELSKIVMDSLLYFDGDRYVLTDAVVMPNHVHLIVAFRAEDMLFSQCRSWKRYTAGEINKTINRRGELWQVDHFDHLIRSPEQFLHYRRYIATNPTKAKLPPGSYRLYSKPT